MKYNLLKKVKLIDISIGKGTYGIAAAAVEYSEDLPTYLRITDINDSGGIIKNSLMSVEHENVKKYYLKENDVVFARTGASTGRSLLYELKYGPLVYAGFLIKFSLDANKVNPNFIKYYLLSEKYKSWVKAFTGGSTRGNINANTFGSMEILLPDRSQQNYLVNILSSLDDKIELNNQMNETLEELAQTLYKHWFIDFEFPNEDGLPYKSSGGKMIESELGLIPEGWEVIELKDLFSYVNGFAFKSKDYTDDGIYNVITIKNVKNGFFDISGASKIIELPDKIREDQILKKGDILMSLTGNVGRVALVDEDNCLLNQRVVNIITNDNLKGLVYTILRNNEMFLRIVSLAKGSAQQNLSPVEMSNIKIVFPANLNVDILKKFNNIKNMLISNNIENKKLSSLRDLLLPKLMSGEIRVPIKE